MKGNLLIYLTQMFFGKLQSGNYVHKDLLQGVNSVVEIDGDNTLKARVTLLQKHTTDDTKIPLPVLSGWYERNKKSKGNPFLIFDREKYSLHVVELKLYEALEEMTDIMSIIVEKHDVELNSNFDLNNYNVHEQ